MRKTAFTETESLGKIEESLALARHANAFCNSERTSVSLHLSKPLMPMRAEEPPIDPIRGREVMRKSSHGEMLTSEEQAYLDQMPVSSTRRAAPNAQKMVRASRRR